MKTSLYVTLKIMLTECVNKRSLKPLTWLFRDMLYQTAEDNVRYFGTLHQYVKYCRSNNQVIILDDVV